MHQSVAAHYRLLVVAYRRYLDADRRLALALGEMEAFFPARQIPRRGTIGAPGSRIRRLCDARDQALLRLQSCYAKFRAAKGRGVQREVEHGETLLLSLWVE